MANGVQESGSKGRQPPMPISQVKSIVGKIIIANITAKKEDEDVDKILHHGKLIKQVIFVFKSSERMCPILPYCIMTFKSLISEF